MVYLTLFIVALLSGSILPLGSEALFIYDIQMGYNKTLLLLSATAGNSLGALINYFVGLKGEEFLEKRDILNRDKIKKYKRYFDKYGVFALFLSPLPIIGDPITVVAGSLKYNLFKFIMVVTFAKFLRYFLLLLPFL